MPLKIALAAAAMTASVPVAHAGPRPMARVEVPIREVVLSDGARRYGVALRIAGRAVEAGLDSGSTGLRVLPRGLPAAALHAKGQDVRYGYGSGTQFSGRTISLPVGIGGAPDVPVRIQRIDTLGCTADKPDCPVTRVSSEAFGIQGDGLPGEGFAAILGIGLKADPVPNTLQALGATRWIIELPRPGEDAPGRLILNPGNAEIAAYRRVNLLSANGNMVAGCIAFAPPEKPICGSAVLDTGAPGLRVVSAERHAPVAQGTPARLVLGDHGGQIGAVIATGRRDQASRLEFGTDKAMREPRLFFGIAPYFAWSVLYDPAARAIGLKPR